MLIDGKYRPRITVLAELIKNKIFMVISAKQFSPEALGIIHFSGIGGIGMSGIAEILHNLGCRVQGSDMSDNANVDRLEKLGIKVHIGQKEENISGISVVVRSTAIRDNNPEIVAARKANIPVIARAEMLKEIMCLKKCITIAGTHGKTTTTSMVAHLLESAELHPTVVNGGILNSCNTNAYLGSGEWLVAEADESDGSFNKLPADIAIVTNIDPEHMEFYGSFANLRKAFKDFIEKIPFYGFAVLCYDHQVVRGLISDITDRRVISYGFSDKADVVCKNLILSEEGFQFDVIVNIPKKEQVIEGLKLPMYGKHNVSNALSAITVCVEMGVSADIIKKSLGKFLGVKRRLTVTGMVDNITIIDDYGHHPTEIEASLKAVKEIQNIKQEGRLIAVIQPHRYSRVFDLFNDFVHCVKDADLVFISDIYAAGEQPISGINKESLIKAIKKSGQEEVYPLLNLDNVANELKMHVKHNDTVICLGAGDITKYSHSLPEKLKQIL